MYQNAYYDTYNKMVHVWDDQHGHQKIEYERYAYAKDDEGEYTSLYGDKLSKITKFDGIDETTLFESDIKPIDRTLIDLYINSDEVSKNHRIFFFDIETNTKGGISEPEDAWQPITSIAYFIDGKIKCVILDNKNRLKFIKKKYKEYDTVIIPFTTEYDMLDEFIKDWVKVRPTIITHWKGDSFDVPYLINRISNVFNDTKTKLLSPIGKVHYNRYKKLWVIAGVSSLDYMKLYKNFTYTGKPSYGLDAICTSEIGRGKVKYSGNLDDLMRLDINKFIEYNIEDVLLMVDLDAKLKLIELAQAICHKGHVIYEDVYANSRTLDGASIVHLNKNNIIAPNKLPKYTLQLKRKHNIGEQRIYVTNVIDKNRIPSKGSLQFKKSKTAKIHAKYIQFEHNYFILETPLKKTLLVEYPMKVELMGAFVDLTEPGLFEWVGSEDLVSLYPKIIETQNISPETKLGRITNWSEITPMKDHR